MHELVLAASAAYGPATAAWPSMRLPR